MLIPSLSLSKPERSGTSILTITHQRVKDGEPFKQGSDWGVGVYLEHAMSQRTPFLVIRIEDRDAENDRLIDVE